MSVHRPAGGSRQRRCSSSRRCPEKNQKMKGGKRGKRASALYASRDCNADVCRQTCRNERRRAFILVTSTAVDLYAQRRDRDEPCVRLCRRGHIPFMPLECLPFSSEDKRPFAFFLQFFLRGSSLRAFAVTRGSRKLDLLLPSKHFTCLVKSLFGCIPDTASVYKNEQKNNKSPVKSDCINPAVGSTMHSVYVCARTACALYATRARAHTYTHTRAFSSAGEICHGNWILIFRRLYMYLHRPTGISRGAKFCIRYIRISRTYTCIAVTAASLYIKTRIKPTLSSKFVRNLSSRIRHDFPPSVPLSHPTRVTFKCTRIFARRLTNTSVLPFLPSRILPENDVTPLCVVYKSSRRRCTCA